MSPSDTSSSDVADIASAADYAALASRARDVLDCWFGAPGSPGYGAERKRWFARNNAFDAMLRERFGSMIDEARAGALDSWAHTPLGTLALIIMLDQFSRNCHRDTPLAFAADPYALRLAQSMVATGADLRLPSAHHRAFAYLPFEHDESPASQREALRLFKRLQAEPGGAGYYRYAERHAQVINRFGRFPHRNATLGRASTEDEERFLRERGSSF